MECPNCSTSNPVENRFCGTCGVALTEEPFASGAVPQGALSRQIEQAIDAKLGPLTDRNLVELEATEKVIDRVWKWVTRFATVVAIPIAAIIVVLGFWGVGSYEELEKLRTDAEADLISAVAKAGAIKLEAELAAKTFDLQAKELAALEKVLKDAAETVNRVKDLEKEVQKAVQQSEATVNRLNQSTRNLDNQLRTITKKQADLGDLAIRTANLATTIANKEGNGSKVKALSDQVAARIHFKMALIEKNVERQIVLYTEVIKLDPNYAFAYYARGIANQSKGNYDRAIADYDRAMELDPDDAVAFNNKAWLLATVRNAQLRDGPEAVRLAREAVRLNDIYENRDTLAAAFAEAGQFADAVAEQKRAIEMARAAGKLDLVADLQGRLDLYRRQQPYRD